MHRYGLATTAGARPVPARAYVDPLRTRHSAPSWDSRSGVMAALLLVLLLAGCQMAHVAPEPEPDAPAPNGFRRVWSGSDSLDDVNIK